MERGSAEGRKGGKQEGRGGEEAKVGVTQERKRQGGREGGREGEREARREGG